MEATVAGELAGRIAVITGGTRGIGRMLADGLARAGAFVEVIARRSDEVAATERSIGPERCGGIVADLATDEGIDRVVGEVAQRHSRIDLLVNNAATSRLSPLDADDHGFAAWDKVLRLNVAAPFLLTVRLLPLLEPGGVVVNIGSIDGLRPPAHDAHAYAVSKAALHHLTEMLAPKLGRRGVRVNAIAPSAFRTRMSTSLAGGRPRDLAAANPLGRIGEAADILGAVRFLASDASSFVNGAVIPLDGAVRYQPTGLGSAAEPRFEPDPAPEPRSDPDPNAPGKAVQPV